VIGFVNQLFTHADPTAYTNEGQLVQMDVVGLSAYLVWLRDDVLESSRFQHELAMDFDPAELERLFAALEDGETFLAECWKHPGGNIKRRCLKEKERIKAIVRSVITRRAASDALFTHVFPDVVLVERFNDRMRAQKASMEKKRAKK